MKWFYKIPLHWIFAFLIRNNSLVLLPWIQRGLIFSTTIWRNALSTGCHTVIPNVNSIKIFVLESSLLPTSSLFISAISSTFCSGQWYKTIICNQSTCSGWCISTDNNQQYLYIMVMMINETFGNEPVFKIHNWWKPCGYINIIVCK